MSITPDLSHLSVSPRFLILTSSRLSDLSHSICTIPLAVHTLSLNAKGGETSHVLNLYSSMVHDNRAVKPYYHLKQLH